MSDQFYDNFGFDNPEDENKTQVSDHNPTTREPLGAKPYEPQPRAPYANPYSSTPYQQPAQPVQPVQPVQQPVQPAQPVQQPIRQTDPYANAYRQPLQSAAPVSSTPAEETPKQEKNYDDGFYHRSYSSSSAGNHVNYTRPSGSDSSTPPTYTTRISSDSRKKAKSGGLSKGAVAVLLIVCILVSGLAGFGGSLIASKVNGSSYEVSSDSSLVVHKVKTEADSGIDSDKLVDKTTTQITTEVADTVVEITTEVMQTSSFYGQYIAQGAGSGVIISEDGYILTNNHVIEGASSIQVTTRGGDTYDATLIGTDSKVDIALLKIEATGLPVAIIGDSDDLSVGDKAVIIGNPLGTLGGSVTEGIISALDRSIDIDGKTMHLMQTDAAINPGNSGGGMFNGQGELSGIVVAKSSSEEIDNIGFVIPINNVMEILDDLKDYGYVRGRADTGMTFIDLSNSLFAYYYYRTMEAGVYVNSVENGSNAAQAGFQKGDRVVSVDGKEISTSDDITSVVTQKNAGDTVTFVISRNGSTTSIDLVLDEDIPDGIQGSSNNSSNVTEDGYSDGMNPYGFFGR